MKRTIATVVPCLPCRTLPSRCWLEKRNRATSYISLKVNLFVDLVPIKDSNPVDERRVEIMWYVFWCAFQIRAQNQAMIIVFTKRICKAQVPDKKKVVANVASYSHAHYLIENISCSGAVALRLR